MNALSVGKDRVLLVDDEPQVLVALEDLLSDEFTILKSESAAGALALVEKEPEIAVVISDQRMPRMGGDELLARLGSSSDAVRILITGFADLSAVVRAVNEGKIFAYVTKPWNATDFRLTVGKAVQHFRLLRELADERRLLRDLMDNIPDGIYFKDRELCFRRANRAFAAMVGAESPDALVGMSLSDLTSSPEFARESEADERRLLEHGSPLLDVVRRHRQGKKEGAWVSETKAPILSSLGGTLGIVGVWRDVTDRIEMSEALRNSEERLREQTSVLNSILDSMGDGVVVADREGQALLFTEQAERLLGGPPPEKLTAGWHEAFGICLVEDKRPLADADNPLLRAMLEERTVSLELLARDAHGPERVLAVTATPLRGKAGLAGGVALLRDVTQERALEQQLFHSQKMDAIGRLAGGVAHDFNNLLSVIQSYAQLFLNGMREDDPLREDMGQVMAASQLAASLTRQLLAFCRRQVVQPKVLQVNAVVADIEKMLRRIIGEDIALVTSLSPGLGAVRADPGHIEQIIVNLTVNARDAMPDGGTLRIETGNVRLAPEQAQARAVQAGEYVVLRVSDTGIGMSPETRERIFEPFFTTKDVGKGTGLGLSTVYGIVQQAGGQIVVESELGHGTSLEIQFPRVDIARADGPDTQSIVAASAKTATILLVEDNEAVRTVGARILRGSGYTVFDTGRASEARALCRDRGAEVNLLLIDVVMPEISGPKLATELVVLCPNARVLFMSGYAGTTLPSEDSWHERAGFLEKPFTPASLVSRVREVLETATSVGDRAS